MLSIAFVHDNGYECMQQRFGIAYLCYLTTCISCHCEIQWLAMQAKI